MIRDVGIWIVGVAWLVLVAGGFWMWDRYHGTPGSVGTVTATHDETRVGRWHLTVFAHPHCPCTRASLRELEEIAHAAPELSIRVLFIRPSDAPDGWDRGENWDLATQIAGAEVDCDESGIEAHRFGAETSGFAVLTDPSGQVVFRGGITPGRARTGENSGRKAVLDWIAGRPAPSEVPVFGCPTFTPVTE